MDDHEHWTTMTQYKHCIALDSEKRREVWIHIPSADAVLCTAWIIWPTWTQGLQPRTVLSKNASISFATAGMLQEGSSSSSTISVATERLVSFSRSNANSMFLHLPVLKNINMQRQYLYKCKFLQPNMKLWWFNNYHWGQEFLVTTWRGPWCSYLLPAQKLPSEGPGW